MRFFVAIPCLAAVPAFRRRTVARGIAERASSRTVASAVFLCICHFLRWFDFTGIDSGGDGGSREQISAHLPLKM